MYCTWKNKKCKKSKTKISTLKNRLKVFPRKQPHHMVLVTHLEKPYETGKKIDSTPVQNPTSGRD